MQLIRILLCKGLLLLLRSCREDVRTERIIGTATSYMVVRMALTRAGKQNEEWEYLNHRKWSRRSTLSRRWWWARWESSAKTWPQSNSAAVCECTSCNLNSPWSTESIPFCSLCLYVMLAIIFWSVPNNSRWLRSVFDFQLVTPNGKLVLLAEPVENVQAALIHEHDGVLRRHTVKCYKRIYGLDRLLSICPLNPLLTFMFVLKLLLRGKNHSTYQLFLLLAQLAVLLLHLLQHQSPHLWYLLVHIRHFLAQQLRTLVAMLLYVILITRCVNENGIVSIIFHTWTSLIFDRIKSPLLIHSSISSTLSYASEIWPNYADKI